MTVGGTEFGGEVNVAAQLQHSIVVTLENGVALRVRELEFLQVFRFVRLERPRFSSFISDMKNMLKPYPRRERSASNTNVPGISSYFCGLRHRRLLHDCIRLRSSSRPMYKPRNGIPSGSSGFIL
jgi:hypothetical protein